MGIYLQSFAARSSKLGHEPHKAILNSARVWVKRRGLAELFYADPAEDQSAVLFSIYPPAGVVQFSIGPERVDFGTKTSIAGPGYHLALVDLCDHLHRDLGLAWRWDADGDSSGYAETRSRKGLYQAFVDQLRAQCNYWRDHDRHHAFAMNLEIGLGGDEPGKVSMPMGSKPIEEVVAMGSADDDTITEFATGLYPWWFEEIDERFWLSSLRAMLWTDVPWRKPDNAWERHVYEALAAVGAAIAQKRLPPDLEKTIDALHEAVKHDKTPSKGEIGYRRRDRRFDLTGNWRLVAPGYYHESVEGDDRDTVCIWHPEHEEIRATSFRWKLSGDVKRRWPGTLRDQPEHQEKFYAFRLDEDVKKTADGWGRTALAECVARPDENTEHLLLLSITSQLDADALLERLRSVLGQISYDPERRPNKVENA